ncbi:MAG TPA: NAD-binding protein [Chthoniobacteraceae bacterium]|jgi:3-hydroxyisobutyrate dehydrogenase-like beta-hydroxyacid dehydrogenase
MPRKSRKNVGLIGLGIIGSRAAAGLRAAGFQVFVWNRSPKPAPNFLGSPAEVAELCEIVQIFVADAQALFDVLDQMSSALTPKHLIICNATVGPEAAIEAARLVEERGARFLDAPFTGSKTAAERRDLVYYLGGDDASCLRAKPVLEATSRAIVRIGDIGHAATIKVVTNMIAAVSVQTLGEALAIVQKAGLDPEVLAAALEQNACRSGTMDMKLPKMIASDYEPHFSLKHMFKDVQLGIHVANALDIEIPVTTVTAGVMYGALNQGWSDLDFSAVYKVYESQVRSGEAGAELPHTVVQIEDLDAKEVHYPETKFAAPPRPETGAGKVPAPVEKENDRGGAELPEVGKEPSGEASRKDPADSKKVPDPIPRLAILPKDPPSEDTVVSSPAISSEVPPLVLLAPLQRPAPKFEPSVSAPEAKEPQRAEEGNAADDSKRVRHSADDLVVEKETSPSSSSPTNGAESSLPIREKRLEGAVTHSAVHRPGDEEENTRPLNFVKRWFVSRRGG